jgi:ubiquitin-like 1-activating enzyme E1 B
LERATLNDLVENILRQKIGYGEEFSINTDQGTIYDPDLEDNLPKKLSDLGIKPSSFITVVDEDDHPRVNLQIVVVVPGDSASQEQSIVLDDVPEVPRKPKAPTPAPEIEHTNGTSNLGKRKRGDDDEADIQVNGDPPTKRVANGSTADGDKSNPINLDESVEGAILIDDD